MSTSTRKEKVEKKASERPKRSYELKPIKGDTLGDRIVREEIKKPAELSVRNVKTKGNTINSKGIAKSQLGKAASLPTLKKQTSSYKLKPIKSDTIGDRIVRERLEKPAELPNLEKRRTEEQTRNYKLKPIEEDTIGDRIVRERLEKPEDISLRNVKTQGNTINDKEIAESQLGNPEELPELERRQTFSEMLAPLREAAIQEKTDALKMQKYYALADVFNALGKMGGAAVGGAIGGNMLDSAPNVGEYSESRGYLDAFERAKQANERLLDLEEQDFQLAYDRKRREEERAYNDKVRKLDREYKAKLDKEDKEWQKSLIDYKTKIDQAASARNLKLKAQLESEAQTAAWNHQLKRDALLHGFDMEEKKLGQDTIKLQKDLYADKDSVPFTFNNGTAIKMPKALKDEMLKYFAQKGNIDGVNVDEDNVADVLRDHPNLVSDFLKMHGMATTTSGASTSNEHQSNGTSNQTQDTKADDSKKSEENKDDDNKKDENKEDSDFDIYAYEVK